MSFEVYRLYTRDDKDNYWETEQLVFSASKLIEIHNHFNSCIYKAWKKNTVFFRKDNSCYEIRAPTGVFENYEKGICTKKLNRASLLYEEDYYHKFPKLKSLPKQPPPKETIVDTTPSVNDLPLRSCFDILSFEEKRAKKRYYCCYVRNVATDEKMYIYSNCYLARDIDQFRKKAAKNIYMNFMVTKKKVSQYGRVMASVFVEHRYIK